MNAMRNDRRGSVRIIYFEFVQYIYAHIFGPLLD